MVDRFPPLRPEDLKQVAAYAVRARLGSGGMGSVYLAFSPGGYPLAIKVVRRAFADDPEFRRRFRREIAAALRAQSYYTAPVRDAAPDDEVPWYATEYIAGPSLEEAVSEHGPLPVFSVFRLLAGAAEGIAAGPGFPRRSPGASATTRRATPRPRRPARRRKRSHQPRHRRPAQPQPVPAARGQRWMTATDHGQRHHQRNLDHAGHPEVTEQKQRQPGVDRDRLVPRARQRETGTDLADEGGFRPAPAC